MKTFRYKGVSRNGVQTSGVIKAYDEYEAISLLRENHTIVNKITEVKETKSLNRPLGGISQKELALICSQFSIILSTGLPVLRCVEMVAGQTRSKQLRKDLGRVAEDIAGGFSMAQSFEKNMPQLPVTFIETVRAGEQSGTLEACFDRLYKFFDKSAKNHAKVISALTYPAIVVCVAIVVFIIIMVVAVPMFTGVFQDMNMELPAITRALIAVSDFMRNYFLAIIGALALIAAGYLLIRRSQRGRIWLAEIAVSHSPFSAINNMNNCAQFADTMSTMLAAGLPIIKALEITATVMPNLIFGEGVRSVLQKVQQGYSVNDAMNQVSCFPKMLTEMTGVGEAAGSMDETLTVIGEYYSSEVQLATTRLMAMLEPAVTILLALFTVVLLMAVYLPLFTMYGAAM